MSPRACARPVQARRYRPLKGHDQIVITKQGGWAPHPKALAGYLASGGLARRYCRECGVPLSATKSPSASTRIRMPLSLDLPDRSPRSTTLTEGLCGAGLLASVLRNVAEDV